MKRGVILITILILFILSNNLFAQESYKEERQESFDLPQSNKLTSESGLAKDLPSDLNLKDSSGTQLQANDIKPEFSSLEAENGILTKTTLVSNKDDNQITLTDDSKTLTFNLDNGGKVEITKEQAKYSIKLSKGVELILNQFSRFLALQDNSFFTYFSDIEFSFSSGSFTYDNSNFKEFVQTSSTSKVNLNLNTGILCTILSKDAFYKYSSSSNFKILNSKLNSYEICTRKSKEHPVLDKDAFLDFIKQEFKLKSIFNYYIDDNLVIESLNTNNIFTLKNKEDFRINLLEMGFLNGGDVANIYNNHKYFISYNRYYLILKNKYPSLIDRYEAKLISIQNNTITNNKNKVEIK